MRLSRLYKKKLSGKYNRPILARRKKDKATVSSIAAFNSDGKLLFGLRNDTEKWTLPGGHAEEGEDPRDAAIRELKEETGLDASDIEFLGDGYGGRDRTIHVFCYKAVVDGDPTIGQDPDDECSVWTWVDAEDGIPETILDNLHNKRNITLDLLGKLDKKADVNIIDELPEHNLSNPTEGLSFPNAYPAVEELHEPDSYNPEMSQMKNDSPALTPGVDQRTYTASFRRVILAAGWMPAFKNIQTGQVVRSPGMHNINLLPEGSYENGEWIDGFVDPKSVFYDRAQTAKIMNPKTKETYFDSADIPPRLEDISSLREKDRVMEEWMKEDDDDKTAGGFGYNLQELDHGLGGTQNAIMSEEHNVGENLQEDPDLKLGEVAAPYSDELGSLSDQVDDDKKYDVVRGALKKKMADLIKDSIALPDESVDENKYEDDITRQDESIPRDNGLEGPLRGR